MPSPRKGEKEQAYISRAVPQIIKEGHKQDQAVAIAYSMWRNKNKKKKNK